MSGVLGFQDAQLQLEEEARGMPDLNAKLEEVVDSFKEAKTELGVAQGTGFEFGAPKFRLLGRGIHCQLSLCPPAELASLSLFSLDVPNSETRITIF